MNWTDTFLAALQTAALFLSASVARSQTVVESDSATLVLRMELSQPSYRVGDTVRVRFTLRNTVPETVKIRNVRVIQRWFPWSFSTVPAANSEG